MVKLKKAMEINIEQCLYWLKQRHIEKIYRTMV